MKQFQLLPERWLIRSIHFLVGATFIIPLVTFSGYYFPYIVPRNVAFRIIVELLVLLYVILILQNRSYLPRMNRAVYILTAFIACMTLSSLFAGTFVYSFWSNYERMDGLVTAYHLYAFFLVMYGTFKHRKQYEQLMQWSLFVAFIVAFIGLSQQVGVNLLQQSSAGERITSTLGNATYLAAYLLIHSFIALYFLIERGATERYRTFVWSFIGLDVLLISMQLWYMSAQHSGILSQLFSNAPLILIFCLAQILAGLRFLPAGYERFGRYAMRILMGVIVLLFSIIIANTQTRGAIAGIGAALVFGCVYILFKKGERKVVRFAMAGTMIVLALAVGLIFEFRSNPFVTNTPILNKIASISLSKEDTTTLTRLATWKASLQGFYSKPILGWGVENYQQVFNLHFPVVIYTDEGTPLWFDRPHNLIIQYLVEGGVIGAGLYLLLLAIVCITLLKKHQKKYVAILLAGLIIAYLVQNVFVFDSINSYIPYYFLLAFMVSLAYADTASEQGVKSTVGVVAPAYAYPVLCITVLCVVAAIYGINYRPLQTNGAYVGYYRAQTSDINPGYKPAVSQQVFTLIDHSPFLGRPELLGVYSEFAVGLLQDGKETDGDMRELVQGLVTRFDAERKKGYTNDARFNMFEMNLYLNAGKLDPTYYSDIVSLAKETIALSPTRPQLYYIRGRAYMNLQRNVDGIADFEHAVQLAPLVPDAHFNLLAGYATVGDAMKANQEVVTLKKLENGFDIDTYARLTSIYVSTGLYDEAIALIHDALIEHPDSKNDLEIGLAQIYAAAGRNAEARATMKAVVAADPSMASYANDFYQRLDAGGYIKKR